MFQVDPRPYQAQLDQAQGQVNLYKAQLELAKANYARDKDVAKTPGAVSVQQLDQDKAAVDEADAAVKAFQASLEVYKLNLSFTEVTSPIDGQVSRYFMTLGNLVVQDQTLLTTVVSLDPMYVYFDIDEGTVLRARRAINEGTIKRYQEGGIPVLMALQGEDEYRHQGTINFVNNQVNPNTGSISARGVFDNPKPAKGVRLLSPGMFVRVRLPIGRPQPAVLVIDRAIGSDQGLKFVYVVDAEEQSPVPPDIDRCAPGGWSAGDQRGAEAGRVGGGWRLAASPPAHADQAGADADALLGPAGRRRSAGGDREQAERQCQTA